MLRPRRLLCGAGALAFIAAVTASGSARGQGELASQFGSFKADAEAAGFSLTYDAPGLIPPAGTRLFQVTLPQAQSVKDSSPGGSALASLVYPGPILSDLNNVIRQGAGQDLGLPPYPAMQRAFYPSDKQEVEQSVGAGTMRGVSDETTSDAIATYGSAHLPGVLKIGAVTSTTKTTLEEGQLVSRGRSELGGIDILAGLIHIESLVTDLVATSNGTEAATDGTTQVSGVTFLGLPATLDGEGLHLDPAPGDAPPPAPSPLHPVVDQLGLGKVADALKPAVNSLNGLMTQVLGTTTATLDSLLEAGGLDIKVLQPDEVKKGAEATRASNGLQLTISYDGTKAPVLSQLLALIPVEKLPNQGIPGVPLTDPQSIVLALKGQHIFGVGLGPATVHVVAAPPFTPKPKTPLPKGPSTAGTSGTPGRAGTPGTPGRFTTPTPGLTSPSNPGEDTFVDGLPIVAAADPLAVAGALMLLLMVGALAWAFSGRLADNVLAATGTSCPEGMDHSPPGDSS